MGQGASAEVAAAWVMIGAEAVRQPEVREVYQGAVAQELATLTSLLEGCLRQDGRDPAAAAGLAPALLAFMEGAFQLASAAAAVMPRGYAPPRRWTWPAAAWRRRRKLGIPHDES